MTTSKSASQASATGARTSPATSTSSPTWPGSATSRRRAGHACSALPRQAASPPTSTSCSRIPDVDAVVVATPVVTHYDLARRALLAGKHVFVEKPMAVRASEAEELVALAEERDLVLMPGHLLLYHPGVQQAQGAGRRRRARRGALPVRQPPEPREDPPRGERALESLGAHDLSVILHLVGEEPIEVWARGESFLTPGVEDVVFCYLRFPSGKVAHMHLSWLDPHKMRKMTVVGTKRMAVFDDMELERKITIYEKATEQPARKLRRVADAHGRHLVPEDPERRAAAPRGAALPRARRGARRPARGSARTAPSSCARSSSFRRRSSAHPRDRRRTAVVYPGTVLGEGCVIGDYAVVGKQPALSPRSTARREPLPPLELGPGNDRLGRGRRVRGHAGSARADRGRPVLRARAVRARRRRRHRARLAGRERHDDRRPDEDPGRRIRHRVLDAGGGRLHRPLRRDHERQLHGPNGEAPRAAKRPDDPARGARRRRRGPAARNRGRRGGLCRERVPSSSATFPLARSWSATRRARSARYPTTSSCPASRG